MLIVVSTKIGPEMSYLRIEPLNDIHASDELGMGQDVG
jgi:hypothetical protein